MVFLSLYRRWYIRNIEGKGEVVNPLSAFERDILEIQYKHYSLLHAPADKNHDPVCNNAAYFLLVQIRKDFNRTIRVLLAFFPFNAFFAARWRPVWFDRERFFDQFYVAPVAPSILFIWKLTK